MPAPVNQRRTLLACFIAAFALPLGGEPLGVQLDGETLVFTSSIPDFLSGKHLDRLHDGTAVTYIAQSSLLDGNKTLIVAREVARFVVSYDLWEEKFSITRLGKPRRSVSHLSAPETESWAAAQMSLPVAGIGDDRPVWARLEIRAEPARNQGLFEDDSVINLSRLVEIFGRRSEDSSSRWLAEKGPFHLAEIRRNRDRGSVTR